MKSRFLRRAGALLLVLAMACSLLTVPVMALGQLEILAVPKLLTFKLGSTQSSQPITGIVLARYDNPAIPPSELNLKSNSLEVIWEYPTDLITIDQLTHEATAQKAGEGTIFLTVIDKEYSSNRATAKIPFVVEEANIPVTWIRFLNPIQMLVGETTTLNPTILPESATDKRFTVSITKGSDVIEIVNNTSQIRAKKAGEALIRVETIDGSQLTAECTVIVREASVSGLSVSPKTATISPGGDPVTLTASLTPSTVENKNIRWSMPDVPHVYLRNTNNGPTATISADSSVPVGTTIVVTAASLANPAVSDVCVVQVVTPPSPQITSVAITNANTDASRYVDPLPGQTLKLNAEAYPLTASEEDRRITWTSSDTSIARVDQDGVVTGVAPGKAVITATAGSYSDTREIEVSGILLSYLKRSTTGGQGTTVNLTSSSVEDIYQYRDILVTPTTFGNAKNKAINWESSNNTVAQVVNGRVTANFPGENVTISASVAGTGFSSSFKVRVLEDVVEAIPVNMGSSSSYSFASLLAVLNSRSQSKTGAMLECVYNLKVSTENGTLYYKYVSVNSPGHGVGGTEYYYYQPTTLQMGLRDITFIPSPGFNGVAIISYNARAVTGTTFTGTIRIEAAATGDVAYSTEVDQTITFSAEHFSAVCMGRNNQAIRYITFDQPASSRGTLYQDYAPPGLYSPKVSSSTRYYVTSKPSIDQITFVPAAGYVGTVAITYHCVDSTGASFTGIVSIQVGNGGSGDQGSNAVFSTGINQRLTLYVSEFNSASHRTTGGALDYIRFESLPSTSVGRLYLNYTSTSSTGTQVTIGRNYYRNTSPRISSITFVPAAGYSGTVTIPYRGTNVSGTSFSGSLIIHVGVSSSGTTVRCSAAANQTISFYPSAFNEACRNATGDTLNYIRFTSLPSSSYGTLSFRSGTAVNTSTTYYYAGSTRPISDLTFTARGVSAYVTFGFIGYNIQGASFSGTVEIEVAGGTASSNLYGVTYYTGASFPITFRSLDFQSACQAALGTSLASVQFNILPATGRLYLNYSSPSQPGTPAGGAVRYGTQELDQITYLPKAEYQGTITIPYTGYDTQGGTYSGTITIQLANSYCTATFADLSTVAWATPSIEFLRYCGITNGYSDNTFRPRRAISRGEFTLMICRAFQFPTTGSSGFPDVPANSVYAGAVASARNLGIVQGENGLFRPDRPISRQSAMTMIFRAMSAAGQPLPAASTELLSPYWDANRVSRFARSSVAALIQSGVVRGTSDMRINPTDPISRAEMAVILHRVLTQ